MQKAQVQFLNETLKDHNYDHLDKKLYKFPQLTLVYENRQPFLLVGMEKDVFTLDDIRNLAGQLAKKLREYGIGQATFNATDLTQFNFNWDEATLFTAFYEGWYLGQYAFNKYKKEDEKLNVEVLIEGVDEAAKKRARSRSEAVRITRDLCNEPPNVLHPDSYGEIVTEIFKDTRVEVTVYGKEELKDMQMNGILAVSRGSGHSPKLIQLSYKTSDKAPHIALVGKGVTFDNGGINMKHGDFSDMKMDMGGSAAVVGAMKLLQNVEAEVNVTALIPVVDNMVDAHAFIPSEILHYKNGTSVHVGNTDAEGRLVLADGILFAQELGATTIIDIATLTGSIGHALGLKVAGVLSNRDELLTEMKQIGEKNGDQVWPLPLVKDYNEWLETPYADIANVGTSPYGGAITAALFLNHFVKPDTNWIHVDMANTVQSFKNFGYYTSGASGFGARLLADFVLQQ